MMMTADQEGERPIYYAASETPAGVGKDGYVGVTADPASSDLIGLAIPCGAARSEAGDELALFSLVIEGRELPGLWTCRGGKFVRSDDDGPR